MKYKIVCIMILSFLTAPGFSQELSQELKGEISFITSENVYVKFGNTSLIQIGDTLRLSNSKTACLKVNKKSTNSVVCSILFDCQVEKGAEVYFIPANTKPEKPIQDNPIILLEESLEKERNSIYEGMFKSRISLGSYSTLSELRDDRHRMAARISINASHINDSKWSFESYVNYRQNIFLNDSSDIDKQENLQAYDLAVKFDATPTLSIVVGRRVNPKISSVGAIDGLQVEKYFGDQYVGVIGGFRPDIYNYDFNADLLEYGAYYGRNTASKNFTSTSTIGVLEQRNTGEIDRRYAYVQHRSIVLKKLHIFSSAEVDLYDKVDSVGSTNLRLTNIYASARYRFNRNVNATLSYDARKRIIYYETYQSELERLLDDDITRQGVRIRINGRPMDKINAGIGYSKRFQSDRENKSDNIFIYLGISKLPYVGGRVSLNFNINNSNYLESNVLSVRHSRTLFKDKLNMDLYYRKVDYTYLGSNNALSSTSLSQSYYGANLSFHLSRRFTFSVSGEMSNSTIENNYRINTRLVKRFYSRKNKKKK